MSRRGKSFSPEFKLEAAGLVVEQSYSIKEACEAMNVSETAMCNATKPWGFGPTAALLFYRAIKE